MTFQDRATERGICLTEAEAIGLLELIMTCPGELDPEQRAALLKLSDYCRKFLRDDIDSVPLDHSASPALTSTCAA